ncbi:hypothetical protein K32_30980 [Kaistia sp. 32K]|uniref:glycosyltransferase n=1 Tax=Kaistia sp. 32K TaxID=2795690 RepID=UPI001916472A|nr:glycosyltransferase [Kaistia sp. 32K]BCP54481.1 hypothetical protein K32_30980 [Kaistia sp. 32K]
MGIPRVESALIRQVLRRKDLNVVFYRVDRGKSRLLTGTELRYLEALVERRIPYIEGVGSSSYWSRIKTVYQVVRASGGSTGRELDRVAAGYLANRADRKGLHFELAKFGIRIGKLGFGMRADRRDRRYDPLADPTVKCFLSNVGLHALAAHRQAQVQANITAILHDTIPLDMPRFVDKGHAASFVRDFQWMREWCRQLVCVSEYSARTTRKGVEAASPDAPRPTISVNRLGSFLREGMEGRPAEPVAQLVGSNFAVYCSTIEIRKNHITLLRVWQRLMPLLGERMPKLVLCGRWGWMVEETKQYLADHPELAEKVCFLSGISDPQLAWLYQNARFGVFPSVAEGWGLGAAECLDFGLPVLVSDADALSEATQGLMPVIPAADLEGWVAAIVRAATDDAWLAALRAVIAERYRPISELEFASGLLSLMGVPPVSAVEGIPLASGLRRNDGEAAAASPAI